MITKKHHKDFKIAIVVSRFNKNITERLLQGAYNRLLELNILKRNITTKWVPGAVEIPLIAQKFAVTKQYDAIICLGVVIRGETGHYHYVCQQVSTGCQQVALTEQLPVIFGVLSTENKAQALARSGGEHSHKGEEAAETAVEMIALIRQFSA